MYLQKEYHQSSRRLEEIPRPVLTYIGKGFVCIRTLCNFIVVDNITVGTNNHSNTCVCNFTNIIGCDLSIAYSHWDKSHAGKKTFTT